MQGIGPACNWYIYGRRVRSDGVDLDIKEIKQRRRDDIMSHKDYKHMGSPATRTIEECSELIKAICKAERFGYEAYNPLMPIKSRKRNKYRILEEIEDVRIAMQDLELFILQGEPKSEEQTLREKYGECF